MIAHLLVATAVPFLLVAAATDISVRMVSNFVCAAVALDGAMIGGFAHDLSTSLLAMLCVFVPAIVFWRHGFMGGGDAKLLAAVSLLVPAPVVPSLVLTIALVGGVLALMYWTLTRLMAPSNLPVRRQTLSRILRVERYRIRRGFSLPYAVAISGGTLFTLGRGMTS